MKTYFHISTLPEVLDKDIEDIFPHFHMTSYYPTAAIYCVNKCWFCVPFVFQGVSNFCSDTLFKLQNITLVIEGVYYCGATRAIASTIY